ncbi:sulfotransferase [Nitrosomonas sp. JL21]|uniref:sulfotransferase family protein n=1 Tax=Nitrosomonas sp. JL21 TaxID=153949 RepID=UPI001369B35E|nr:sulfotransferase [Nitrosomonas sp. JL21]MBL8496339.1 sulfotransferase [Nitrosomonas sp.]MXS79080.1 sulfotransferase [Nitrosomonas sp. JL21]
MSEKGKNVIFLLGAGRSGTTLLYKILSMHRSIAYLSNYQKRYPNWPSLAYLQYILNQFPAYKRRTWFKEKGNAYFNEKRKWLHAVVPTPSEAESVYASCGIPLTPANDFCLQLEISECIQNKFECIRQSAHGEVLLSKRTANNRRIPLLKEIFPSAKYIHLIRDGRAVAYSALQVAWWNDHLLYWAGKTPRQMVENGFNPLELAAQNWVEEMKSIQNGIELLQESHLLEVRYDELLQYPHEKIQCIFDFMGVTSQKDTVFWNFLETLQLAPKQEKWISSWTESELNLVHHLQQETLCHWGFNIKNKAMESKID